MADTIDLTSDSPPRTVLHLPVGSGSSVNDTNAVAGPSTPTAVPASRRGSGRNTRQTASQRQRQLSTRVRSSGSQDRNEAQQPRARSTAAGYDGFELTGMSEGARLAAEAAQREAENAQMWRRQFIQDHARRRIGRTARAANYADNPFAAVMTNDMTTSRHDQEPVGQFLSSMFPAGPQRLSFLQLMNGLRGQHMATDPVGAQLLNIEDRLAAMPTIPDYDPRLVLNRKQEKPDQDNFTYGIIEPPIDVETFEDDPRIITGPLPDTSAICAGCDCALVIGGLGKRKLWALPCGHVVDGRCYQRYRSGISATKARRLAKQDIKQEESAAAASEVRPPNDAHADLAAEAREARAVMTGTKRLASQAFDESTSQEGSEKHATPIATPADGSLVKASETMHQHNPTTELQAPSAHTDEPAIHPTAASPQHRHSARLQQQQQRYARPDPLEVIEEPLAKKDDSAKPSEAKSHNPPAKVETFTCPVEGCKQRVSTAPGKPTSAIELYL